MPGALSHFKLSSQASVSLYSVVSSEVSMGGVINCLGEFLLQYTVYVIEATIIAEVFTHVAMIGIDSVVYQVLAMCKASIDDIQVRKGEYCEVNAAYAM